MDQKKTDYGNWVPLALMKRLAAIAGALLAGEVLLIVLDGPTALTLLVGGLLAAAVILWLYMLRCRVLFDFNRGGLMGQVHQYLTDHLPWDGRGTLLDIGCGSGALTIRCAKRFPNASLVGVATPRNSASRTPPPKGSPTGFASKRGTPPTWPSPTKPSRPPSATLSSMRSAPSRTSVRWYGKPCGWSRKGAASPSRTSLRRNPCTET